MGMPITIEIVDGKAQPENFKAIFDYFFFIDEKFSPYKTTSELSAINRQELEPSDWSREMKEVFDLAAKTKQETAGYFNIVSPQGLYDPSGLVKGWAVWKAALLLKQAGFGNFYIEAGGDIEAVGHNARNEAWQIGIRNPFNKKEIVKILRLTDRGLATSGNYERGEHIWNPKENNAPAKAIASLTVVGPNVYEADRFATAAFAMGEAGINFIENLDGFEGYLIDNNGRAVMTGGFEEYVRKDS